MNFISEGLIEAMGLLFSGDEATYSAIFTTVKISSLSIFFSLLIGLPGGFFLGYYNFRLKKYIRSIVDTMLALPTVVVGLLVYGFISSRAPLGKYNMLFNISGIVVAQVVLILPIIISLTATAIEELDSRLKITLITLGAKGKNLIITTILEARFAILTAAITAYGRAISEVGISMMIGGNIKWHTRTITTAIALETGKGEFALGIALGVILLAIAFTVNGSIIILKKYA